MYDIKREIGKFGVVTDAEKVTKVIVEAVYQFQGDASALDPNGLADILTVKLNGNQIESISFTADDIKNKNLKKSASQDISALLTGLLDGLELTTTITKNQKLSSEARFVININGRDVENDKFETGVFLRHIVEDYSLLFTK